jgi:heat-inducible transcriptional repressor
MSTEIPSTLGDRRAHILRALISHYVNSGEPVGSKTLVDRFNLKVSPATVRNELAALEEAGLIHQPHTSAGRIPTDAGYRFFVDRFGGNMKLPERESRQVEQFFGEPRWELEEALRQTASLLSTMTDHAAVVFAPALDRSTIRHLEIVALPGSRAMVVVVTDSGRVYNQVVHHDDRLDEEQLARAGRVLDALVVGVALDDVGETLKKSLERFAPEERDLIGSISELLQTELAKRDAEKVFLEGASNIIDEHKFSDLETVRHVIEALEHRRLLLEVLAEALAVGSVSVRIGTENISEEMQFCSVITAPYGTGPDSDGLWAHDRGGSRSRR